MPVSGTGRRLGAATRFRRTPPGPGGPYNAATYLSTPTPDGTGKGTHVDVVHVTGGWNGWAYWMAFTPFAGSDAALENPNILVSTDGLAWQKHPDMASSEIDPWPGGSAYNSDPDLLLGQDNVMYCYYRSTAETGNEGVKVRSSSNGTTWSAETTLFAQGQPDMLSPTVLWDGTQYVMYGVLLGAAGDGSQDTLVRRTSASPTSGWSATASCTYSSPSTPAPFRSPWHIDAFRMGSKTVLLVNERRSLRCLGFASTTDGTTFTIASTPFMTVSVGSAWDTTQLYRGCAELHPNGTDLRIWYSAQGPADWRVAYTECPRSLVP